MKNTAALRGRKPGDHNSKPGLRLSREQPADDALRSILRDLAEVLREKTDGVIADLEVESLHDFRVAVRRTRSAITQIKGVFAEKELRPFLDDFKWLGNLTGPCRDLDVQILEFKRYRETLPDTDDRLDPLECHYLRARSRAHQEVCRALRSTRFERLLDDWDDFLGRATQDPQPPRTNQQIGTVADARILKAYLRIVERGSRLGDEPPAKSLHRIRIDAKKLRYLLEFFASLYLKGTTGKLVKELKKLQDMLGGFNDMEIHRARLNNFAKELAPPDRASADALLEAGKLSASLGRRQEELRLSFADRFAEFASPESQKRYAELFGGS